MGEWFGEKFVPADLEIEGLPSIGNFKSIDGGVLYLEEFKVEAMTDQLCCRKMNDPVFLPPRVAHKKLIERRIFCRKRGQS